MTNVVADNLRKARALIAKPNGWMQGAYATNRSNCNVSPKDADAVCFCAWGALMAVGIAGIASQEEMLLISAANARSIGPWNDAPDRTQKQVVAAFDKAISLAEAESA